MAFDFQFVDELTRKLSGAIPDGLKQAGEDVEAQIKDILQSGLARLDVVTLEEFEAQTAVLARTREKLEKLERRIARLEGVEEEDE